MNKIITTLLITTIIMIGVIIYLQLNTGQVSINQGLSPEQLREYANKLNAEGLKEEAITAYEQYIQNTNPEPNIQANTYYTMGKLAQELKHYETALGYFYKVEIVYPDTKLRAELGENIVYCLEKMGRGLDAQTKLDARTALEPIDKAQGKILAKIGNEVITEQKLNEEIQKLPKWMQEKYNEPEKKSEFLKQYIAIELLSRKAARLGYYKDPAIRQKAEDFTKELVVNELLDQEMQKRIEVTPDQVELYYNANKEQYVEPAKVKIKYFAADTEAASSAAMSNPDIQFTEINTWITKDQEYIPDIGNAKELVDLSLSAKKGDTAGPVKIGEKYYVISVINTMPQHQLTFEEVKDRVSHEYNTKRQMEVFQDVLETTLKAENVEIYE